jgi:hypothetical protein
MGLLPFTPHIPNIPFDEIQVPVVTEFYRELGKALAVFSKTTGIGLTDHEHLSAGLVVSSFALFTVLFMYFEACWTRANYLTMDFRLLPSPCAMNRADL